MSNSSIWPIDKTLSGATTLSVMVFSSDETWLKRRVPFFKYFKMYMLFKAYIYILQKFKYYHIVLLINPYQFMKAEKFIGRSR